MHAFCLDYQPAVAQVAGIGRYTRELARHLPSMLADDERLRLFYCDFKRKGVPPSVPAGVEARAFRLLPGAVMQKAWTYLGAPPFDLFSGAADLFHFTNFVARPVRRGASVLTVHDMSFERFPQFAEERNLRYLRRGVARSIDKVDAVITDSHFSKKEIEEFYPAAVGKTFVTHLGIDQSFRRASDDEIRAVREKLGLTRPYLLCVGTIEPRKNHLFLMDAWEKLAPQGIDLVVSGAPGWRCDEIFKRFENTPFKDRFHYIRYAPDGSLGALYSGAALYVTPSHYEGFGFPPLEAMACGTPVVSSPGGSLEEVLGDAASIVRGFDADAWAHEILRVIALDGADRAALLEAGRRRAASFTWEKCVRETLAVYRDTLKRAD